jgi:hypothetical protein
MYPLTRFHHYNDYNLYRQGVRERRKEGYEGRKEGRKDLKEGRI